MVIRGGTAPAEGREASSLRITAPPMAMITHLDFVFLSLRDAFCNVNKESPFNECRNRKTWLERMKLDVDIPLNFYIFLPVTLLTTRTHASTWLKFS